MKLSTFGSVSYTHLFKGVSMKNSGIIAEYNPFHLGHKYQIDKIKKELNTNIISIMSGDFVQRGECTILDLSLIHI